MSLAKRMLKGHAVYWPPAVAGKLPSSGFGAPVDIRCRWEMGTDEKITNEASEIVAMARVYTSRDVEVGGMLWEGKKADLPNPSSKTPPADAVRIKQFKKLDNVAQTKTVRWALL